MSETRYFLTDVGRKEIEEWAKRNPRMAEVLDKEIIKTLTKEESKGDCHICGENHADERPYKNIPPDCETCGAWGLSCNDGCPANEARLKAING